jgi:hypothetical protein
METSLFLLKFYKELYHKNQHTHIKGSRTFIIGFLTGSLCSPSQAQLLLFRSKQSSVEPVKMVEPCWQRQTAVGKCIDICREIKIKATKIDCAIAVIEYGI